MIKNKTFDGCVSMKEITALKKRMLDASYTQRNLAMYLGIDITGFNKVMRGYRYVGKKDLSQWNKALDKFDKWTADGMSIFDMVVVDGKRFGGK